MNRLSLIGFVRSLSRHKLYAALNIGGLAVGIAVFLILGLYVRFETGYESWIPQARNVWLIESHSPDDMETQRGRQSTPVAAWSAIHRDLPDIMGSRLQVVTASVVKGGIGVSERLALVDPDFFKIFPLQVVAGRTDGVLNDPNAVVITQRTATKYFGSASPIGQTLNATLIGQQHGYRVAAVIADMPADSEFDFDLVSRLTVTEDKTNAFYKEQHFWNYGGPETYVRTPDDAAAQALNGQFPALLKRHVASETPDSPEYDISLSLQRLTDKHFETPGSKLTVTTLGIVGLLTLLLAIVNYVNLASARAGLRAREVAMRKVLGASRAAIVRHYMLEAVATAAIAALLGLAIAEAGLPLVNAAGGLQIGIHYFGRDGVVLPLALLVLLVGACAGAYPAVLLSRFPAAAVLASARSPGGGRAGTRVREILVVFQFAVATAFMIGTMVLVGQTMHVRKADVGFGREQLLVVRSLASYSLNSGQRSSILHRFASLPGVRAVSAGNAVPGGGYFTSSSNFSVPGQPDPGPALQFFEATPGFFQAVGARLVAGRIFDLKHPGDLNPNLNPGAASEGSGPNGPLPTNVILNETAVRALHYASPQAAIGKSFGGKTPKTVIGVVQDMRFGSPRLAVPATLYSFVERDPQSEIGIVRFTGDPKEMLAAVRGAWLKEAPEVPFEGRTASQALDKFYARDDHTAHLFTIGAVLAVLIGCVGLWGLASFNTARRTREIGIRKTLGASSADVVKLLVGQFLRPVLIANLFAWPLAYVTMRTWLAGFDDRIALSPLFFLAATLLSLVIALVTVIAQSLRAARATPAWALRHE
jgi:putative ABC transport system permease protein